MRTKFIKYTFLLSIGTVFARFFIFLFRIICARELSLANYGLLALVISICSNIFAFSHFSIAPTLSHFFSKYKTKTKNLLPLIYGNSLFCIIPTTFIAIIMFIAILFYYEIATFGLILASILIFIAYSLFQHNQGVLNGFKEFKATSFAIFLMGFSRFLIVTLFFYIFFVNNFYSAFYAFVLSFILPSLFTLFFSMKEVIKISFHIDWSIIMNIYRFSFFIMVAEICGLAVLLIPRLILSFNNFEDVAIFDIAFLLYGVFNIVLTNIPSSLIPLVTEKFVETKKIPKIPLFKFALISFLFLGVSYLLFYFKLDAFFITLVMRDEFLPSLPVFHILFISLPFFTYSMLISGIIQGIGKVRCLALINFITLIMAVPLFYFFSYYSIIGLSIAFVILVVIKAIISHYFVFYLRQKIAKVI